MARLVKKKITELTIPCFVAGVVSQSGNMKIKRSGWVRSEKARDELAKLGILEVAVDLDKKLEEEQDAAMREAALNALAETAEGDDEHGSTTIAVEMNRAKKIYNSAKRYQKKLLTDIKADRPLDLGPVADLTSDLIDSIFRNSDALSCLTRLRNKDDYLLEHSINVSILMTIFAKHLELDRKVVEELALGALLHDMGKIKIEDAILNKPGRLTDEEFATMKLHAVYSRQILEETEGVPELSLEVAALHHERMDGNGYPFGKDADDLSLFARMIAICDVYDAVTADRCYKDGMNPIAAFRILMENSPNHFDPELVQKFVRCMGVHPVGTVVKLESGKLGVVTESNKKDPLKPIVKVFYHTKFNHHIDIKFIDLGKPGEKERIETSVKPEKYNINIENYF